MNAVLAFDVRLPRETVWGQMRDWRRFLTLDPLHAEIIALGGGGGSTPRGAEILIPHRLLGLGPTRRGKMLTWREGEGYDVSDLSRRGNRVGFPHICTYRIEDAGESRTRITLGVRGRWTSPILPRWFARAWIAWVLLATRARVIEELEALRAWRTARG